MQWIARCFAWDDPPSGDETINYRFQPEDIRRFTVYMGVKDTRSVSNITTQMSFLSRNVKMLHAYHTTRNNLQYPEYLINIQREKERFFSYKSTPLDFMHLCTNNDIRGTPKIMTNHLSRITRSSDIDINAGSLVNRFQTVWVRRIT